MVKYINSLKLFLSSVIILFSSIATVNAQYLIKGAEKIEYQNDSVILYVNNVRGTIQWQVSKDKISWENIVGEINDSLLMHVDSSAFYRTVITEGTCAPVFSDTVLVAQVYDNRDNQFYDAVKIGTQWWMAENLNYNIPGGSWYYDNDSINNAKKYGRLFNWRSANIGCPADWHLPSDNEWKVLESELGMSPQEIHGIEWRGTQEGDKLKPFGSSNFNSLFAGYRDSSGLYHQMLNGAAYWTISEKSSDLAWYRGLGDTSAIHRYYYDKDMAFSIRCVKNQPPALLTNPPISIATKSVLLNASILHNGGSEIIEKGFCWSLSQSPTISNNFIIDTTILFENTDFNILIDGLQINTTYYVRAYAKNEFGIGYGNEISIKTLSFSAPIVITSVVKNIGATSVTAGGKIIDSGERDITGKGVCWSAIPDPTILDNYTINGTGIDAFNAQISGLKPNSQYFVRAYAINNMGISYGENRTFITLPVNPTDSITDSRDGKVYKTNELPRRKRTGYPKPR